MADGDEQLIVWEWMDDQNSWQRYSPKVSNFIEQNTSVSWNTNMKIGKVDRALSSLVVNVPSLQQKNTKTGKVRAIRRQLYDGDDLEDDVAWQYSCDGHDYWASYDSTASAAIEQARQNSTNQISLTICNATYTIDLTHMTQTRDDTNKIRQIRRSVPTGSYLKQTAATTAEQFMQGAECASSDSDCEEYVEEDEEEEGEGSVKWQFLGDDNWTNYDGATSKILEQAFQNGTSSISMSVNNATYDIDMNAKTQTRQDTEKVRKIRRVDPDCSDSDDDSDDDNSDQEMEWEFCDNGNWTTYDSAACKTLEDAFQSGSTRLRLRTNNTNYSIDLVKMTQMRCNTKKVRAIKRKQKRPGSASSTTSVRSLSPLVTREEQFIIALQTHTWLYQNNDGRDAVNLKWKGISITKVEKIQSNPLWTRYKGKLDVIPDLQLPSLGRAIRTTDLQTDYHDVMGLDMKKELLLFHGTKIENITGIKQQGISMNFANAGLYGKTIYLSDCCQKADQYSDDKNNRRDKNLAMVLCRAVLGKVGLYQSVSAVSGYDSMVGGTATESWRRFYEFMISDDCQIYPAFVIYYNRV